jgi:signal transduction histidine kinase/ligand-binding sensor domain-containing protein/DNA-binding response OmpR family regulator
LNKYDGYSFTVYKHDPNNPESLSDNEIASLYEDRSGVLWIGTYRGGLNKFDRETNTFSSYRHDPDNPNSLSANSVMAIHEDRFGVLWVGTAEGGLNKLVLSSSASEPELKSKESGANKATFVHFEHDPDNPNSLSNNAVFTICEDRTGVLWIGTFGGGLNKFDRQQQTFTCYKQKYVNSNYLFCVFEDHFNVLWIGSAEGGLTRFNRETGTFTSYLHNPNDSKSLSYNRIISIFEDHLGSLWIGTYGKGLNKFDRESEQFLRYQFNPKDSHGLSNDLVASICEDRSGALWIGTEDGLNKFDREIQKFRHFTYDRDDSTGLSSKAITSFCEDRSGVLWLGTSGGGLNRFDQDTRKFTHFTHIPDSRSSLYDHISAIHEDRTGVLWIATLDGLFRMDPDDRTNGKIKRYKPERNNPKSLSSPRVITIHEDQTGVLWFGTSYGLNRFDRETDSFTRFVLDPKVKLAWADNAVWRIFEDHFGNLWNFPQPSSDGISRFDQVTKTFTRYTHDPNQPSSLSDNQVYSILEDHLDALWIGTQNGLNKYDRVNDGFVHYQHDPLDQYSLSNNSIRAMYEDSSGTLWIGTHDGLNKYDRASETFLHFGEKDGLAAEEIHDLLEDGRGNLWLITDKGLSKFNPQSGIFRNYDQSDGLQGREFNAFHKGLLSGKIYLGGPNGFNVFHPDSIKDNPYIPPVVITRFERYNIDEGEGKPIIKKAISEKQHIELSYKDNILTFEFAALSYLNNSKNQYAYKLEGFNENWIQLGTERKVTFTNLDPGEYTLRVKGTNNDGIWNENGASLKITITPPWWKTWWAYSLYVILLGAILYGVRRFELNRQRLKQQLEMEHVQARNLVQVDRLKSRFFANISHEFRTPLTLILGPIEKLRARISDGESRQDLNMMQRNAKRLLQLINQLLDLSKLEAGGMKLQARPENIVTLLRGVTQAFESLARQKEIDLQFRSSAEEIIAYVERDKVEKILINLLSNAFKFTAEGGQVSVQLSVSSDQSTDNQLITESCLLISVRDTGIGIPEEQLSRIFDRFYQVADSLKHDSEFTRETSGTGIGLALAKDLVELHHGEISVTSEVGRGTEFIIRLPLGKEHLQPEEIVETSDQSLVISEQLSVVGDQFAVTIDQQSATNSKQRATSLQRPVILIVDDNADMRVYMRGYLENDYRLVEAENGVEGLKQARKSPPDLIISDVMMPKMDGFQFCEGIKTEARTSHIPVILLTAKASGESKLAGLETGADDYLTKPFDAKELQVRVKNLIAQRRRLKERFQQELKVQPKEITVTSMDEALLQRMIGIVEANMGNSEFDTATFARKAGMSRGHLNSKLRALTNCSSREFIRTLRLKRAAQLLEQGFGNVTEVAFEVGFDSLAHFAKVFRDHFGLAPKEYVIRLKGGGVNVHT